MIGLLASIPFGVKITLFLLGLLFFLTYRYLTKNFGYWKKQGIVFEKPVPLFGSVAGQFLLKEHPLQWAQRLYKKHEDEPFIGFYQGRLPGIIIKDLELIKHIFVKDFSSFMDHGIRVYRKAMIMTW